MKFNYTENESENESKCESKCESESKCENESKCESESNADTHTHTHDTHTHTHTHTHHTHTPEQINEPAPIHITATSWEYPDDCFYIKMYITAPLASLKKAFGPRHAFGDDERKDR